MRGNVGGGQAEEEAQDGLVANNGFQNLFPGQCQEAEEGEQGAGDVPYEPLLGLQQL